MKKADRAASKTPARLTRSQRGFLWAFGVPTFLLYVYICIVPMLTSVRDSLFDWDGYGEKVFVGLKNYKEIFTDPVFGTSVKNDLLIVFFKEIIIVVLATLFAMCLTRLRFGKREGGAYRYLLYLPNILSIIVITRVWKFFFELGLFDRLLKMLGIGWTSQNGWLADYPLPIIIFVASWCGIGGFMIILISSINNISQEVYEAADIDGAGVFRQMFSNRLPAIMPQIRYMIVTILTSSLAANLNLILPFTGGGPGTKSYVMGLYVYNAAYTDMRVGYANAAAIVLMLISVALAGTVNTLVARREER